MLLSDLEKLLSVWENVLSIVNVKANRTVMLRLGKEDGDRVHHFAKRLNRLVSNLHDLQKGWALRQFGALEHLLEEKNRQYGCTPN